MKPYERKWWFATPVMVLTIASTYWLLETLGIGFPPKPISFPGVVLFFIVLHSFQRIYTHVLWVALLWLSPQTIGEKKLAS
jgi:hypothetical protein